MAANRKNRKSDLFTHKADQLNDGRRGFFSIRVCWNQSNRPTDWQLKSAGKASLCQQGEHSAPLLHAIMQLTSILQAKSFFGSTYNLLSSSTRLRSLVTCVRKQTRSRRHKRVHVCEGVGAKFLPRTSAASVSPCGRTSPTPAGTSSRAAR